MKVHRFCSAALAGWLGLTSTGLAQEIVREPGRLNLQGAPMVSNQNLANTVADTLRKHPQVHRFRLDIAVIEGVVELSGQVADTGLRSDLVRQVSTIAGVVEVRDRLMVGGTDIVQIQVPAPIPQPAPAPLINTQVPPPPSERVPSPGPAPWTPPAPSAGQPPEPAPIFQGQPGVPNPQTNPPPMPPYAWPTYAPYNNFSRVAHPLQYQYDQFPFIGPMYPYPKVPLGWRAITLSWEDGHWWYAKTHNSFDWWRIRYW